MRHIVIVPLRIYHFARLISVIIDALVSLVVKRHHGVEPVLFNTVVIPNLHHPQTYCRTELMMPRQWTIELRQTNQHRQQKNAEQNGKCSFNKIHSSDGAD